VLESGSLELPEKSMRACATLLLLLILASCSVAGLFPDWVSDESAGPEPANYRFIIANGLGAIIGSKDDPNSRLLEITTPRRVDATKGATWLVCVKSLRFPSLTPRAHYAVFIQRGRIIESRLSVVLDQCESQPYSPFEWSIDINNPVPLQ
jgi:hypothetical protein